MAAATKGTRGARLRQLMAALGRLATPSEREGAIRALARILGARAAVLFVRDVEIGVLLPAPGFPRTLPDAKQWQEFLGKCMQLGAHEGTLPYPDVATMVPAIGVAAGDETALVLLGGSPDRGLLTEVALLLPLLAFAFRGEQALHVADAQAVLAQRTAEESRVLARILDEARADLQQALAETQEQRRQVKRQAAELEAIFQALPGAVFMCDVGGRLVHANAHAEGLLRMALGRIPRTLAESLGPGWPLYPDGSAMAPDDHPLAQALQGASRAEVHCMLRRADAGEEIHLLMSAEPMRDEAGHIAGAVAIATDITRLHQLEREKDDFLSIASHELRTPLTAILANVQLAERRVVRLREKVGARGSEFVEELDMIRRMLARTTLAAERQKRLADDLLDVSRIQGGMLELRRESCDLAAIVREHVEELRAAHPARDIRLELPAGPVVVMADADRIRQVLTNYLSNALKYSPADAPMTVSLYAGADAARVDVRDQGPGLPPEEHARVWERFHRVEGISHVYGSGMGLGLGLYICKTIVERHGGQVGIESAPGAGSTFWFELPVDSAPPPGASAGE